MQRSPLGILVIFKILALRGLDKKTQIIEKICIMSIITGVALGFIAINFNETLGLSLYGLGFAIYFLGFLWAFVRTIKIERAQTSALQAVGFISKNMFTQMFLPALILTTVIIVILALTGRL